MKAIPYICLREAADFLRERLGSCPEIAVILGSGLGGLAAEAADPVVIDYSSIPNFLISTAPDHAGKMVCGTLAGRRVLLLSGRFHYYEGYSFEELAVPVHVLKLLGVRTIIATNAAGAVDASYQVGDVMVIADHIKLCADSPLRGPNLDQLGPRFFDVSDMYTARLRKIALDCSHAYGQAVHEGVYMYFAGPQFETPAEIRAARLLGANAVGMSTVTEALTAAHCSIPFLGLSVITNMAAGVGGALEPDDVQRCARRIERDFICYVKEILSNL